jgi:uncharacterized DUF497 family protein
MGSAGGGSGDHCRTIGGRMQLGNAGTIGARTRLSASLPSPKIPGESQSVFVYTIIMPTLIGWDEPKRDANLRNRKLDFAHLTEDFFVSATLYPAKKGRSMVIGQFQGHLHCVVFKALGTEAVSVISMRRASHKESRLHGKS